MRPHELALKHYSSPARPPAGLCLADNSVTGAECAVYAPTGGRFTANLSGDGDTSCYFCA